MFPQQTQIKSWLNMSPLTAGLTWAPDAGRNTEVRAARARPAARPRCNWNWNGEKVKVGKLERKSNLASGSREGRVWGNCLLCQAHLWPVIIITLIFITTLILMIMMVITKRTYKKEAKHSTQTPLQKSMLLSSVERSDRAPPDFASLIKYQI